MKANKDHYVQIVAKLFEIMQGNQQFKKGKPKIMDRQTDRVSYGLVVCSDKEQKLYI